jgi:hypothetical protein
MKYILIGLVVIGMLGVLALVYPMFGNKYRQPVSPEQRWKEKIAYCSEMKAPKNLNAVVNKFSEEGRKITVSFSTVIYDCPDGMFVY